jgi:hypothetical protein
MRSVVLSDRKREGILREYQNCYLKALAVVEPVSLQGQLHKRIIALYQLRTDELETKLEGTEVFDLLKKGSRYSSTDDTLTTPAGTYIGRFRLDIPDTCVVFKPLVGLDQLLEDFALEVDQSLQAEYEVQKAVYDEACNKITNLRDTAREHVRDAKSTGQLLKAFPEILQYLPTSLVDEMNSAPAAKKAKLTNTPKPKFTI